MIVRPGIPDELRWFDEARFGMFIHFGLYALLGRGEWVMYEENIPRAEYEKLAHRFNPHRFDACEWVQAARNAGARYITVTAKHHDGFCLFDTALTDFNITNTPFGRDLIGELVEACQQEGMRIIFYYSQPDWHHPNYVHNRGAFKDLDNPPETDAPDWHRYTDYYIGQVRELCTNYGSIDGIWFDGSHKTEQEWRGCEVYAMIKALQPHAVVNDRARYGDFFTPERSLPDDLHGFMFEACESISPTSWGYQGDTASFSSPHLIRSLVRMASTGGNYLLNVGPAPDGTIPSSQIARMRDIGRWLERFGDGIYGTEAGPFLNNPSLRSTRRENTLFIHMAEWPEVNRVMLPGPVEVESASLLPGDTALTLRTVDDGIEICDLPSMPIDASVNTIRLDLKEVPDHFVRRSKEPIEQSPIAVSSAGVATLPATYATLEGRGVKGAPLRIVTDERTSRQYIDYWMVPEHAAHWQIDVKEAGEYRLTVSVRCPDELAGARVAVEASGNTLIFGVPGTGTPPRFETVPAGTVRLNEGLQRITVRPEELLWGYLLCGIEQVTVEMVRHTTA